MHWFIHREFAGPWFVALASLAKAATPDRLKVNAVSDHIRIVPGAATEQDKKL